MIHKYEYEYIFYCVRAISFINDVVLKPKLFEPAAIDTGTDS